MSEGKVAAIIVAAGENPPSIPLYEGGQKNGLPEMISKEMLSSLF
jgi:hypothetical protein